MAVKQITDIPGPNSIALLERRKKSVAKGHGSVCDIFIQKAESALLTDVDGNVFIDFAGGIGSMNVGHMHPKVIAAAEKKLQKYIHTCFTVAPYEGYIKLAERLSNKAPINSSCKAAFFNSGAEAVENAVKISKTYTGREGVLVFTDAFHGRTLMTMTMTYKDEPYKKGFGPFAPQVHRLPFPSNEQELTFESIDFEPKSIACAVIEPVIGEGGFIPATKAGMINLSNFCKDNGIVLVDDEIQTGFGRTGTLFAIEQFDIEPDLITVAKSIAGGFTLSGVIGKEDIMDSVNAGGIGGTYGGNPVSCAAALSVLDIMEKEQIPIRARHIGQQTRTLVQSVMADCPWIKEVRGIGAMIGIVIIDPDSGKPDKLRTGRIHQYALQHGLIMITAGTYGNVIRTLMPLIIDDHTLAEGLSILLNALKKA